MKKNFRLTILFFETGATRVSGGGWKKCDRERIHDETVFPIDPKSNPIQPHFMKSTILTLSLVLVAGLAVAAEGDKPAKGKGGAPDPAKRAEMMLKNLDKDSNGSISKEEFAAGPMAKRANGDQEKIDKAFARIDKDGDGSITKEELEKMPAPKPGAGKKPKGDN